MNTTSSAQAPSSRPPRCLAVKTKLTFEKTNVPQHVHQWLSEMEEAQACSTNQSELSSSGLFTDVEAEVIEFQRTSIAKSGKSCDDESSDDEFGRHMFQTKKAHRVACLFASMRLMSDIAKESCDSPKSSHPDTLPVAYPSNQ
eukprot:3935651-Rhodomonas_salina.1